MKIRQHRIDEQRVIWERGQNWNPKRIKRTLSFDELLDRFSVDCNSIAQVAVEAGVTRQRMHQIYDRFFRPIFGRRSGRQRQKVCTRKRFIIAKQEGMPEGRALEVAIQASAAGKRVETVWTHLYKNIPTASGELVRLNGHLCVCHTAMKWKTNIRYITVGTKRKSKSIHFHIALSEVGTFVIPADVFRPPARIYIPYKRPDGTEHRGMTPRMDYWMFHEAWDLIPEE